MVSVTQPQVMSVVTLGSYRESQQWGEGWEKGKKVWVVTERYLGTDRTSERQEGCPIEMGIHNEI